jgi:hypothetical protein
MQTPVLLGGAPLHMLLRLVSPGEAGSNEKKRPIGTTEVVP